MEYTLEEVQAMSLNEVKEKLERVMIADRDSNNYVEAYIFYDQEDELSLGVVYAREEDYDFDISVVAGYEFDIRSCENVKANETSYLEESERIHETRMKAYDLQEDDLFYNPYVLNEYL